MKMYILNAGGTLGMVGNPLRPAKSADELLTGISIPEADLTLVDAEERLDSTNVSFQQRLSYARQIMSVYDEYDAFGILHGTDSLDLTCAALSLFFKLSLQKTIFVISAQMTKDEPGSDVSMQIANSIRVAGAFHRNNIAGVYCVSMGEVLHGARVKKRNEADFSAFHSPGRWAVAKTWPHILINEGVRLVDPVAAVQGLRLDEQFESRVAMFDVSADTPPWVLMDLVKNNRLAGAILVCKGAGNIPDRIWEDGDESYSWIDVIAAATQKGIHIGIISPFDDGRVILDRYELGAKAKAAGALSLESLTPAMGDFKFRQAIAMFPNNPDRIQSYLSTDMVGELLPGFEDFE